ncbi:MAG TPA: RNA-binding transcriptional accessory protein [Lachnospiraceae bacterium]|nr:RNA-binding transcriptional accessory protein [Lachnospiraceae bacterium]
MKTIAERIAEELKVKQNYVENVISLIDEGNTIPFIARYRKEMHGTMDDTTLRTLEERLTYLRSLEERKETVKKSIEEQGKLTEELSKAIDEAETLSKLEDLYRPYKQKKRTRATIAKEKGLEPLALAIMMQGAEVPAKLAEKYIDKEKGVETVEDALAGASDIIAENISNDAEKRDILRELIKKTAVIESKAAKEEDSVYRNYYDFSQPLGKMQGHQTLAINRGEKEEFLKVSVVIDDEAAKTKLRKSITTKESPAKDFIYAASDDAYDRLIWPSLEREVRSDLTEVACDGAIHNFALNLKPLLMQPPVKGSVTMGLDPGYRNGCKVAVVDGTGKVLDTTVVYPTFNETKREEAITKLSAIIKKDKVRHIAIGNGTASRETESMAADMIKRIGGDVSYAIVNEAGASVYSASKLAAEEFPDYDVNIRSAVSIARRLQDPLAELVKIEPQAIGVGQYQHDMPEKQLEATLTGVVEDCVNAVGVDVNTASPSLLTRVSGLTKTTAKNIVLYREENGAFKSRKEITKVPKLGPKAYEQCAGFLRVPESKQVLDNTAVHPESYKAAEKLLEICGYTTEDVKNKNIKDLTDRIEAKGKKNIAEECGVGVPTMMDIASELMKPGRDPREELPPVVLRHDVLDIKDLKADMELTGTVRNVIDFGVFVDIGVHQDGLVHISQICDRYIKHPSEVVSVGDIVKVKVLDVDEKKNKISLTMKLAKSK